MGHKKSGTLLVLNNLETTVVQNIIKEENGKYIVYSEDGKKKLGGPYDTKAEAQKRLKQIEGFKKNSFQDITFNIQTSVRNETMAGRDYMVVPMVMITEGILNGSHGPLFYPEEELSKTPAIWNHKPIVVYHPQGSACDPVIINSRGVGMIMNAKCEDKKLKAEAWLEKDRLKKVDNRVLEAIEKGEMVEVSTGVFTDNEITPGEYKGKEYYAIARNYRPDHLAILPDQIGACSIEDGAGLLRLNQAQESPAYQKARKAFMDVIRNETSHSNIWTAVSDKLQQTQGDDAWVEDVFDNFFIYRKDAQLFKRDYSMMDGQVELGDAVKEVMRQTEYKDLDGKVIGNERGAGQGQGGSKQGDGGADKCVCPECGKTVNHEKGKPCTEVSCPECGTSMKGVDSTDNKEKDMDKEKFVNDLISNQASRFEESDREWLMTLEENQLEKLEVKNEETAPAVETSPKADVSAAAEKGVKGVLETVPEENAEVTTEEYIANAPEGIRDVLQEGLATHNVQKQHLIAAIIANEKNTFDEETLNKKSLGELKSIAALAVKPEEKTRPVGNFAGLADVAVNSSKEEPLMVPVMNFGNEEKN